jgi:Fe-S cluster biogenesis protein NfuA
MAQNSENLAEKVEAVLAQLREGIMLHGGNVELISVDESTGKVSVRLQGACVGCPFAQSTLKEGIEQTLLDVVPGVSEVVAVD